VRALLSQDPNLLNSQDAVCPLYEYIIRFLLIITRQDGRTALHWASMSGSLDIVRYLLDYNAEVDTPDNSGWTPLLIACCVLSSHFA